MLRVLLVIDHLGSGGAQRQISTLASELSRIGYEVGVCTYNPEHQFFLSELPPEVFVYMPKSGLSTFGKIRHYLSALRNFRARAAISFLDQPGLYLLLAAMVMPRLLVIVSERSSRHHDRGLFTWLRRSLYWRASYVVANSHSHAQWLRKHFYFWRRVRVVYNGVDSRRFSMKDLAPSGSVAYYVGVGRISPEKNIEIIVDALAKFSVQYGYCPEFRWVGKEVLTTEGVAYLQRLKARLDQAPLVKESWEWLGERKDVDQLLQASKALVISSKYEGLPNVVVEAFSCGRIVVASDVCENGLLVGRGARGRVFSSDNSSSLCAQLAWVEGLSDSQFQSLGVRAARFSRRQFSTERMGRRFAKLLES